MRNSHFGCNGVSEKSFLFLVQEDLEYRIRLLTALTDGGKDILHFEEEVNCHHPPYEVINSSHCSEFSTRVS
jgi:hypothetical protein